MNEHGRATEILPWGESWEAMTEAILSDPDAPPMLILAAFKAKHGDDRELRSVVREAIDLHEEEEDRASTASHSPFARWADAIEDAGYERPRQGYYDRSDEGCVGPVARLVLASLREAITPVGPAAIGRPVGLTHTRVFKALDGLLNRGLVEKVARGKYAAVNGDAVSPTGRAEA